MTAPPRLKSGRSPSFAPLSDNSLLGKVVMRTHGRLALAGLDDVTKEYTSPIVWLTLNREDNLDPSPNLICSMTVGCESSTSNSGGSADAEGWEAGAAEEALDETSMPGVGLPSRLPCPPNGLYFLFGLT